MSIIWRGIKVGILFSFTLALVFSGGLFGALLYGKVSGKEWALYDQPIVYAQEPEESESSDTGEIVDAQTVQEAEPVKPERKPSARISAPAIRQFPELPSGCEVTSLTMLLNFYGIDINKVQLAEQMPKDETPIEWDKNGEISYWGNPNIGFVGEVTNKGKGFGIYHGPLLELMKEYIPTGIDLTGEPWEEIERHVSTGIPVIVWTTVNFKTALKWVVWDSPLGPIRTTFSEHAVLLVGYDDDYVYVNDPWNGKENLRVDKKIFLKTWEVMGKQAITYTES